MSSPPKKKNRRVSQSRFSLLLPGSAHLLPPAPSAASEEQDKHAMAEDGEWVVVNNGDVMEDLLDGTECEVCVSQ